MTTTESLNFLGMRYLLTLGTRRPEPVHYLVLLVIAASISNAPTRACGNQ